MSCRGVRSLVSVRDSIESRRSSMTSSVNQSQARNTAHTHQQPIRGSGIFLSRFKRKHFVVNSHGSVPAAAQAVLMKYFNLSCDWSTLHVVWECWAVIGWNVFDYCCVLFSWSSDTARLTLNVTLFVTLSDTLNTSSPSPAQTIRSSNTMYNTVEYNRSVLDTGAKQEN